MSKKRTTPFNEAHTLVYGLRPCERDTATSAVVSVACQFCVHFGREQKLGAKRKATANIQYFKRPFRVDMYAKHMKAQHAQQWETYSALSNTQKSTFFDEQAPTPYRDTIRSHFGGSQQAVHHFVNKEIVDVIIGEMLFHPDDSNTEITKERALAIFEDMGLDEIEADSDLQTDRYRIVLKNPAQFKLIVDYVSAGASFRMASRILQMTRERTGLASIGFASQCKVTGYVRYVCALNLQKILEALTSTWTFSLAMDMSTHMSASYLDIRIRLFICGAIQNFHLLAIPMFSRHTGEQIFLHAEKALDVLCPEWRDLIVSISTDGERKMTGRIQGVATRFEQVAKPGFFRLWCGLHQLDIVLQSFFQDIMDEQFYSLLTGLISYLRRQQNLISSMKTKAKKISDTRWESMSKVASWFRQHRVDLQAYLTEKNPPCSPPLEWWVFIIFVAKVSNEATLTFRSLEGLTTLVSQQREGLLKLQATYASWFCASGPLSEEAADAVNTEISVVSNNKKYSIKLDDVTKVLEDLGNFVIATIEGINPETMASIVKNIATCCVELIAGIASIVAERDSQNDAADAIPPVLPHQLVKLRGREFADIVRLQTERLSSRCSPHEIELIEQECQDLRAAYEREPSLKQVLDQCDSKTTFEQGWGFVQERFKHLKLFCGGLATAFPGTSTVESDFSVVKWEKDDCRIALTDFSLEGILHAKQFTKIQSINV